MTVRTLQVLVTQVRLYLGADAVSKDNSQCHGVVPLGRHFSGCLWGDNTMPQPPLQTRQCSPLMIIFIHLYYSYMYKCPGYYRGTIWSRIQVNSLRGQHLRQRGMMSTVANSANAELAPHKTIRNKIQVNDTWRQRSHQRGARFPQDCKEPRPMRFLTFINPAIYLEDGQ